MKGEPIMKNMRSKESIQNAIEWRAKNTTLINLRLNKDSDADILKKLESVGNKQGYIKDLIRSDIGTPLSIRKSKSDEEDIIIQKLEPKYEDLGYMALKKLYTAKHKEFLNGNTSLYYELKAIKRVRRRKKFGRPRKYAR